jgi:hypothetical protein
VVVLDPPEVRDAAIARLREVAAAQAPVQAPFQDSERAGVA